MKGKQQCQNNVKHPEDTSGLEFCRVNGYLAEIISLNLLVLKAFHCSFFLLKRFFTIESLVNTPHTGDIRGVIFSAEPQAFE